MPYPCLRFLPSLLASARSSGAAKKCTLCDKPVYEMERYERKEKVSRAWLGRLSFESSGGEQRLLPTVDALYAPLALSSLCCLDIPPVLLRVPPLRLVADRRGRRLDRGARWQGHRHLQRHRGEAGRRAGEPPFLAPFPFARLWRSLLTLALPLRPTCLGSGARHACAFLRRVRGARTPGATRWRGGAQVTSDATAAATAAPTITATGMLDPPRGIARPPLPPHAGQVSTYFASPGVLFRWYTGRRRPRRGSSARPACRETCVACSNASVSATHAQGSRARLM